MNISESIPIFKRQLISGKTPWGFPLNENAKGHIDAAITDDKNYGNEVVQCKSCGFVMSILLSEMGCPNCGVEELQTEIKE